MTEEISHIYKFSWNLKRTVVFLIVIDISKISRRDVYTRKNGEMYVNHDFDDFQIGHPVFYTVAPGLF